MEHCKTTARTRGFNAAASDINRSAFQCDIVEESNELPALGVRRYLSGYLYS